MLVLSRGMMTVSARRDLIPSGDDATHTGLVLERLLSGVLGRPIVRRTCRILARQVPVRKSALWSAQSHLAGRKSRVTAQRAALTSKWLRAKNWNAPELFAGLLHDSCRMHCDRVALGHRRTGAGLHDLIRRRVSWECRHLLQSACSTKMGEKEKRAWRRGGASWTVACSVQWRRRRHPRCGCTDLVQRIHQFFCGNPS